MPRETTHAKLQAATPSKPSELRHSSTATFRFLLSGLSWTHTSGFPKSEMASIHFDSIFNPRSYPKRHRHANFILSLILPSSSPDRLELKHLYDGNRKPVSSKTKLYPHRPQTVKERKKERKNERTRQHEQ